MSNICVEKLYKRLCEMKLADKDQTPTWDLVNPPVFHQQRIHAMPVIQPSYIGQVPPSIRFKEEKEVDLLTGSASDKPEAMEPLTNEPGKAVDQIIPPTNKDEPENDDSSLQGTSQDASVKKEDTNESGLETKTLEEIREQAFNEVGVYHHQPDHNGKERSSDYVDGNEVDDADESKADTDTQTQTPKEENKQATSKPVEEEAAKEEQGAQPAEQPVEKEPVKPTQQKPVQSSGNKKPENNQTNKKNKR